MSPIISGESVLYGSRCITKTIVLHRTQTKCLQSHNHRRTDSEDNRLCVYGHPPEYIYLVSTFSSLVVSFPSTHSQFFHHCSTKGNKVTQISKATTEPSNQNLKTRRPSPSHIHFHPVSSNAKTCASTNPTLLPAPAQSTSYSSLAGMQHSIQRQNRCRTRILLSGSVGR